MAQPDPEHEGSSAGRAARGASGRTRVVIAGAGVAGLEALLALRALAADRVEIELLAPTDRFVHRPLLVAEPFGVARAQTIELAPLVSATGAVHRRDVLAAVRPAERVIYTGGGEAARYDALLVAPGARPVDAVPGALTFGGEDGGRRLEVVLAELGRRGVGSIAYVVPPDATWTIAAYELALLTAAERAARKILDLEIAVVTPEAAPLNVFGPAVSERVAERLEQAGVAVHPGRSVQSYAGGELLIAGGSAIRFARVVALPGLQVPLLPGLPQRRRGFVQTDAGMRVMGMEDVWAAGDATSFPIKQGGLAAQQADVAARSIAAAAGAHVPLRPFQPVLRAALITGSAPEFLRAEMGIGGHSEAVTGRSLWWPPVKVAGGYLSEYLAGEEAQGTGGLVDLEAPADPAGEETEHRKGIALVLAAAEADAEAGDFAGALRWLALIEQLDLVIPAEYVTRRDEWRRALDPSARAEEAAKRIDPTFASAAAAMSDLERRLGWLRETELRNESEMRGDLRHLDEGMEGLRRAVRRARIG